jgi:hypothetical protein
MQSGFIIKEIDMSFWLIVYLFTAEGEFVAKDVYETAGEEQCAQFAGEVTRTIINSKLQAQFHCLSDEDYRNERKLEL